MSLVEWHEPGVGEETSDAVRSTSRVPASKAFDAFCAREYEEVANALSWSLGGRDLGSEAADEAFARAFERWDKVGLLGNPAGWVYRVGLNWGRRRISRLRRERELLAQLNVDEVYHIHHRDPDLARSLAELSFKVRSVVVLRLLLGYSETDTAEALGVAVGTVKSRLHRGLAKLAKILGDDELSSAEGQGLSKTQESGK